MPFNLGQIPFKSQVYTAKEVDDLIAGMSITLDDYPEIGSENAVKSNGIAVMIRDAISGLFRYMGTVESYDDLPRPNSTYDDSSEALPAPERGDTYNVEEGYGDVPPGTNWAWNGADWDPLGGSLSDFLSKVEAAATYATKAELSAEDDIVAGILSALNTHKADTSNPHHVTGQQVGVLTSAGSVATDLVVTASIKNSAVTSAKIASGAVTGSKIAEGAVTNAKMANRSINDDKLQDNCITTVKMRDGIVTPAKLNYNSDWTPVCKLLGMAGLFVYGDNGVWYKLGIDQEEHLYVTEENPPDLDPQDLSNDAEASEE